MSFNAKRDKAESNGQNDASQNALPHWARRKLRPVPIPSFRPPPCRNVRRGRVSIHIADELSDVYPREEIEECGDTEDNQRWRRHGRTTILHPKRMPRS